MTREVTEQEKLIPWIKEALEKLADLDSGHELLKWRPNFLSAHTARALVDYRSGFAERYHKEGVATLSEAMVEFLAEIETAVLEDQEAASEAEPQQRLLLITQ